MLDWCCLVDEPPCSLIVWYLILTPPFVLLVDAGLVLPGRFLVEELIPQRPSIIWYLIIILLTKNARMSLEILHFDLFYAEGHIQF